MLVGMQYDEELGGMLARPPSRPGIPWCRGCGISSLLLSPGDFCTVFSELLLQAGQEVSCVQRNPWLSQAGL